MLIDDSHTVNEYLVDDKITAIHRVAWSQYCNKCAFQEAIPFDTLGTDPKRAIKVETC